MSARVNTRALRRLHRRESWIAPILLERDSVVVERTRGRHRVPFRQWLRERPRDIRLAGKALRIASAVRA